MTIQSAYAAAKSSWKVGTPMDATSTNLPSRNVLNTQIGYDLYQGGYVTWESVEPSRMRARSIIVLGILAGAAAPMISCERASRDSHNTGRRVVHTLADPSGKWVAVVDEVEYANGLLTSVADRVRIAESASKGAEGILVFSEDALPDGEKPSIAWLDGRLLITVSRNASVLHREARAYGFEVEVRPR